MPQSTRPLALLMCSLGLLAGSAAGEDRGSATAASASAEATATTPDIAARVQPCTACHGPRGHATPDGYYPRIAGKPAGYLFNQMLNFQAARRHFPMMVYLMQLQDAAYLREMADYFASQRLPYPQPGPVGATPALLERGRELVTHGDARLRVPACQDCHGSALLGVEPAVPGLLGVSQDYLLDQLGAWRSGARAAYAPDCMAQIARRLQPEDITAVTAWLASRVIPPDAGPQPGFLHAPPLMCGSFTQTAPAPLNAASSSASPVERGRRLALLADCEACHTMRGGPAFAGGRAIPTSFGTFYSPNITPDPDTGIGRWSAQDFWRALHDGIARDGRLLYPSFPYTNYTRITRSDADAMYAYLRTLTPVHRLDTPHALRFPYDHRALLVAWRLLFFRPGVYHPDAQRGADWNRGAYLVQGLAHCSACHEARNSLGALRAADPPAGGLVLSWYAPSLSSLSQAGLQNLPVVDIVRLLRTGLGARGAVQGPMAEVVYSSLQYVPAEDLRDMALYLRSLPASETAAPPVARASDQVLYDGAALYSMRCATCHGLSGEGRSDRGPALAGNRAVTLDPPVDPIRMVLYGGYAPGTQGNPRPLGMPPYGPFLSDAQIAAVLSYVRDSWSNVAPPVSPAEVSRNRGNPLW